MLLAGGPAADAASVAEILRHWFPAPASVHAAANDTYPILAAEMALVARAVPGRQREFATGRWLARQGLRQLGFPDQPLLSGRLRNPLWPAGILGTISHDSGICAVILLRKTPQVRGIGIDLADVTRHAGRMQGLSSMFVANAGELQAIERLRVDAEPELVLFSLKESILKALAFRLTDFIDLRMIEVVADGPLSCRVFGERIDAALFAAIAGDYLVTAAIVRGEDTLGLDARGHGG